MTEATSEQSQAGLDAAVSGGEALIGMATLGKTAAALGLILVIILVAAAVLRRWGLPHQRHGRHLRVVGSTAVGTKERVVIVEVEHTWLVLGVGGGQVSKLHDMPAPDEHPEPSPSGGPGFEAEDSFKTRFAKAVRHNAGLGRRGKA
ncbi:flagellar biosynthetic protein FliO [Halomonas sp. LR5S13]|uniref:flagellar biosynthetic protein FliO n=1 Tax=Halomonas rhizosphaerae TaxID=3043296 RepID=UPI0024A9BA78|nr:flagellar biosynthetic protein FliO [Halomonas rhizosphaerae]MDI5922807.1 flagellar biosynthetic protein FliO [Halomonas rhizosphaerae]